MEGHKRVALRVSARQDVEAAIDWYFFEAGEAVASAFLADLEAAYRHLARQPSSGSPRWDQELRQPGLRCWRLSRHPYLIFYVEEPEQVQVWRVLHAHRDLPRLLGDPDLTGTS